MKLSPGTRPIENYPIFASAGLCARRKSVYCRC